MSIDTIAFVDTAPRRAVPLREVAIRLHIEAVADELLDLMVVMASGQLSKSEA